MLLVTFPLHITLALIGKRRAILPSLKWIKKVWTDRGAVA